MAWIDSLGRGKLPSAASPGARPHVNVAWALTTLFLRSSGHFSTNPACPTGVLVRRLRTKLLAGASEFPGSLWDRLSGRWSLAWSVKSEHSQEG